MTQGNDWELSKENLQPLKQGRNPGKLEDAVQPATPEKGLIEKQKRLDNSFWEILLKNASTIPVWSKAIDSNAMACRQFWEEIEGYDGPDPLENWIRYHPCFLLCFCYHLKQPCSVQDFWNVFWVKTYPIKALKEYQAWMIQFAEASPSSALLQLLEIAFTIHERLRLASVWSPNVVLIRNARSLPKFGLIGLVSESFRPEASEWPWPTPTNFVSVKAAPTWYDASDLWSGRKRLSQLEDGKQSFCPCWRDARVNCRKLRATRKTSDIWDCGCSM